MTISTNAATQLAEERNRAAAERTLLSWIRNCVMLLAFGFGFDLIIGALNQALPATMAVPYEQAARYIALIAIGVSLFLLTLAIIDHVRQLKTLSPTGYLKATVGSALATAAIILFGIIAVVAVLTRAI
jgi:putative membrane protein